MMQKVKIVFLDRDGVINKKAAGQGYIKSWEEFSFLDGSPEAIRCLNEAGYKVVVVTNQRGVSRGLMTAEAVEDIHERMRAALLCRGAVVDQVYYCPHGEGECNCRKPDTGMLERAGALWEIDKEASFMVGDSGADMLAGRRFGLRCVYVGVGRGETAGADHCCEGLPEAVMWIAGSGR
jgi:histidinol-phosphate phosphatase family protein